MQARLFKKHTLSCLRPALLAATALLMLGGCSMETPTDAPQKRVELQHRNAHSAYPVSAVDDATLAAIAHDYSRTGEGPLEIIISYDPRGRNNSAMNATNHAAAIADRLRARAVTNIRTSIMPVNGLGEEAHAMFEYQSLTARAPTGCVSMGGLDGHATGAHSDYEYGCTIEMLLARQIARPRDLAGRGDLAPADGRRQAAITENYRGGQIPPALSGYTVD